MLKDTLHTDMCVLQRWKDGARGRHLSVHDYCCTTCGGHSEGNNEARAMAISPRPPEAGQGRLRS